MLPTGQFEGLTSTRSHTMRAIKGAGNKSTEARLRSALVRAGIKGWILRPKGIVGTPDFYFPLAQVALFVDGCFWHGCQRCGHIPKANRLYWKEKIRRNRKRDRQVNSALASQRIHVLRAWEHQIAGELETLVMQIRIAVSCRLQTTHVTVHEVAK